MISLQVIFASFDRVALRWSLSEQVNSRVVFDIMRSGNAATGFEKVKATESLVAIDRVDLMSKFKPTFYKVRATVDGEVVESNVASIQSAPNSDVMRLQRRERFKLAKFDGIPAMVYSRRRTGDLCPRCVTTREQGDMGIDCQVCYGTGFKGGYYPPLPIYIANQALTQHGTHLNEHFTKESNNSNLWTSNWTLIEPEDVIIEMVPPNMVWVVTGVQRSERRRSSVRQLLTAGEVDKGKVTYRLPIPDFPFPDRKSVFMFSHSDPPVDFDTVFQEAIDRYVKDQELRSQEKPSGQLPKPSQPAGRRNAATGVYS